MNSLDIGEVAKLSGFKASALRYYEKLGLIQPDSRKGLRRQYDDTVLDRLALISMGQSAGFSLDEIGAMFQDSGQFEIDRPALHAKADEVEQHIRRLRILVRALRHVAECSAPSHAECPSFRKMMHEAPQLEPLHKKS
ncbi:MerR family transcriptional regulator [Sedimentitalea sp. CY04]|uniref:MerR family transcriptional regulator n=1 Tax=Parasedimentitalea denitrificans TaxID=2211118 RepID=A0ABX0W756_9RHOB|nr:helix-turn-helix domain-containing protein [Sedimentitalea sp. CY04]NIZ61464.1 MerR family transcriptional regulator [Sedimentitalea sp. CY04]